MIGGILAFVRDVTGCSMNTVPHEFDPSSPYLNPKIFRCELRQRIRNSAMADFLSPAHRLAVLKIFIEIFVQVM
jgi:hypothetical protein